ncbi:MAG: Nramp family divalent metal transporter [Alcanivoracaceae bacterium]|nr:Nramp family divalent metal transporter [Alcanivoracaceae bacterium]
MHFYRDKVPDPPRGLARLRWYGPGLLWMLSAVGTGSILFTPRVASQYQYELLWLLLVVVFFMWVMIREMARFSIVSGLTMLEGMYSLKGPRGWAVWTIFIPQLFAAAVGIAGLSAVVGSALATFLPGSTTLYALLVLCACTVFTVGGSYMRIELFSRFMALILMAVTVVSALLIAPESKPILQGLAFSWPEESELYIIMPWVGTILAGSMGIVWFGYWTASRGYGGGLVGRERDDELPEQLRDEQNKSATQSKKGELKHYRISEWIRVMTGAATVGVVGGLLVIFSFMVLGSELLAPRGILPEGTDVAVDLTRMLSELWGAWGKILMLAAIIIAIGGSILANQDGWGRSFADMSLILARGKRHAKQRGWFVESIDWLESKTGLAIYNRTGLKRLYILLVTFLLPVIIVLLFRNPVQVMSASGIIAATHTPFIVVTALIVNRTRLPKRLRPGVFSTSMMLLSGIFYLGFAWLYCLRFF